MTIRKICGSAIHAILSLNFNLARFLFEPSAAFSYFSFLFPCISKYVQTLENHPHHQIDPPSQQGQFPASVPRSHSHPSLAPESGIFRETNPTQPSLNGRKEIRLTFAVFVQVSTKENGIVVVRILKFHGSL